MCILSILKEDDNFILTHNRDEDVARLTSETLITKTINGIESTFPMDVQSQGTWILTSRVWSTAILNGANKVHQRKLPYRHSRGILPFMLLPYKTTSDYVQSLNLNQIEPFTQIIVHHPTKSFEVLTWDGEQKVLKNIREKLFVISSSTLYDAKEKKFHQTAIKTIESPNADELAHIHEELSWQHNPDIPMLKTTSQVQIITNYNNKSMKFTKFVNL